MRPGKFLTVAIFSMLAVCMWSCKKPAVTPSPANVFKFNLQLKAKYGSQSFALNTPNIDSSGRFISITALQFYLSHINLIKTDGSKVNLSSAAIVDFSDTTTLTISGNIAAGDFTGISFGCGLDSIQNKSNANDSVFPNPFSGLWNLYWDMVSEYRFEVMEGKWDTQDTASFRNFLVYHIGTNAAYRSTQLNKNFSVCCNTPYTLTLYIDVQQILSNNTTGETINIVTEPETSSGPGDNPAIMPAFADNFSKAFTF